MAKRFIPIQVKAHSGLGYSFQKTWFKRSSGIMLVLVWHVQTKPEFYVFRNVDAVENALGPVYIASKSWTPNGAYRITDPSQDALDRLRPYLNGWDVITGPLLA